MSSDVVGNEDSQAFDGEVSARVGQSPNSRSTLGKIAKNIKEKTHKYKSYILIKIQIYTIIIKEIYLLIYKNNRNPAIFCSMQKIMPDDAVANWALGYFIKRMQLTATEMTQYVDLPYAADHEIRNWDISRIASIWKRALLQHEPKVPPCEPRRIAIFSAYHAVTTLYLALAMVLVRKGHIVDLVLVARGRHDASPDRTWERRLVENELRLLRETMQVENFQIHLLEDYSKSNISAAVKRAARRQSLEDVQQAVHNPAPNLWKPDVRKRYRFRRRTNFDFAGRFTTFAKQHEYDHWLVDSGAWAEYGVAYSILEELGIDRFCPACKVEKGHIVISHNRKFATIDTNAAWEAEKSRGRNAAEIDHLLEDMLRREDPEFYEENSHFAFQRAPKLEAEELYSRLGLDRKKSLVLMLPNVDCDTSVLSEHAHRSFPSMRSWVFETVRFFSRHPEYQLVVRAHPGEHLAGASDRMDDLINRKFPELASNIFVLDSDTDLNTYALMNNSDLVLAYTSDVGWEAVVRDVPAICCGRAHFSEFGFVSAPHTAEEYFDELQQFLETPEKLRVSQEQKEHAMTYADLYCNIIPKPFPWSHYKAFETLSENPVEYVLTDEGLAEYSETFDLLAGEVDVPPGIVGRLDVVESDHTNERN